MSKSPSIAYYEIYVVRARLGAGRYCYRSLSPRTTSTRVVVYYVTEHCSDNETVLGFGTFSSSNNIISEHTPDVVRRALFFFMPVVECTRRSIHAH